MEDMNKRKGIVLPVYLSVFMCLTAMALCADFIEQTVRYVQEGASVLTISSKTLAAVGWGMVAGNLAVRLWAYYKNNKENKSI